MSVKKGLKFGREGRSEVEMFGRGRGGIDREVDRLGDARFGGGTREGDAKAG